MINESQIDNAVGHSIDVPLLATDRLSKRFGELEVLHNISLEISTGEVVCMVGPSGSGKTTLLRCLALLEQPSEGSIRMDGRVIGAADQTREIRREAKAVRSDLGMVFQQFNLWPHMTVLQNIIEAPIHVRGTSARQATDEAAELLEKVGLADKKDAYPSRLSGGQQQRVAIARALAMRPRLLLFDEVTSALDPELKIEVLMVMKALAKEGRTMVAVTHEMNFARNACTRMVFMDEGRIIEEGAPQDFLTAPKTERAKRFIRKFED